MKLLEIKELSVEYVTPLGVIRALERVNLGVERGEFLGVVGESGSGKSTLGYAIIRLLPQNARVSGKILFEGFDILSAKEEQIRKIRGKSITMVFQDPFTSLNPLFKVGEQITRPLEVHYAMSKRDAQQKMKHFLSLVGLSDYVLSCYPFELSGGTQQRLMLAMALSTAPSLIIADEPTSSVDASIQAQILRILLEIKKKTSFSMILITHNIEVASSVCDKLCVMYAGRLVEFGSTKHVLSDPKHPYTQALLSCIPRPRESKTQTKKLSAISGNPPDPFNTPTGCKFHPRCSHAWKLCGEEEPKESVMGERRVLCHLYNG